MMKPVASHETFVGALCVWMHTPRGGYGHSVPVDARIVQLNLQGDRAVIEVKTKDGRRVNRRVSISSLRWRSRP